MGRPARITTEQAQEALRKHRTAYRAAEALGVSESSIKHHLGKTKPRRRRDVQTAVQPPAAPVADAAVAKAFEPVHVPEMQMRFPCALQRQAYANRAAILQQLADGKSRAEIAALHKVSEAFIAWIHNRARA